MSLIVILLSGRVCAGKTTLARAIASRFGALHVKTSDCLVALRPEVPRTREAMQAAGEELDRGTNGMWVLNGLNSVLQSKDEQTVVVLDCVRIRQQADAVRRGFGTRVCHIHLDADIATLSKRYAVRKPDGYEEFGSYEEVMQNETERQVGTLALEADVVISSERCTPDDVLLRAASHAGLFGRSFERVVDVLVGGQYGSEGKGHVASYLSREYDVLVRVGGPNAGHTVFEEPECYTFHHLPSGSRANERSHLVLAPGSVLDVDRLMKEIAECGVEKDRLSIDPQAMIITESDRRDEARLAATMGSTQQGVGAATARRILQRYLPRDECTIAANEPRLRPYLRSCCEVLDRYFQRGASVLLEGTQGTGLSLYHGEYPYVTSRDTTVAGCLAEAGVSPSRVGRVIMVCRTYPIRVQSPQGATSGPMDNEISWEVVAGRSNNDVSELRRREKTSTTKRERRVAEFGWDLLRQSASLNAPTDIALTFADYIDVKNTNARRFDQLTPETIQFVEEVERVATAPVSLISTRFHDRGIIDRRGWQRDCSARKVPGIASVY